MNVTPLIFLPSVKFVLLPIWPTLILLAAAQAEEAIISPYFQSIVELLRDKPHSYFKLKLMQDEFRTLDGPYSDVRIYP